MPNQWSQDTYIRAYKFAAQAHNGQLVPGTELPYLMHLRFVAMEIISALTIEQVDHPDLAVQCALLHDTIEDTEVTYDDVQALFGTDVADGVLALSQDKHVAESKPKFERKLRQLEESLESIKQQPREIWMVKLADRITNLQPPPGHWTPEMIERYTKGAELIHKELAPKGIRANRVAPDAIETDFTKPAFDANPQVKEMIAAQTALGRVGVPDDIGGVAAFVCSDEARWVNGQRLEVSGGVFL